MLRTLSFTSRTLSSFRRVFAVALLALLLLGGPLAGTVACTRAPDLAPLPTGRPLLASLGAPTRAEIGRIDVSVRFPGTKPWTAELVRAAPGGESAWRVGTEPADDALIAHFLETLESLVVETETGEGTDETFGFKPHRLELRLTAAPGADGKSRAVRLRFGDPVGGVGLFFRRDGDSRTWTVRGAWIALLPLLQSPDAFARKTFWNGAFADVRRVRLEKLRDPGVGRWELSREAEGWRNAGKPATAGQTEALERLLRQRIRAHVADEATARDETRGSPDWTVSVEVAGREPQTLHVFFPLDRVLGRTSGDDSRTLEFYPEFAGALRALTQSRLTPVKSFTK